MDDVLDLPPPQYLGKRRQSTFEEIAAFKEKISFKKEQDVEEDGKDEEEPKRMGKGNYVFIEEDDSTTVIFCLPEKVGVLADALKIFQKHNVSLKHIESRQSQRFEDDYEFMVEFCAGDRGGDVGGVLEEIKKQSTYFNIISRNYKDNEDAIPWFPVHIQELDNFANAILSYGDELDSDHPGFTDQVYRERRKYFADIAFNYRYGDEIPRVEYTKTEIGTWKKIYTNLKNLSGSCHYLNNIVATVKITFLSLKMFLNISKV